MRVKTEVAERIMIALDVSSPAEADRILRALEGIPCYMKVGMQLFYASGPKFVQELKKQGYRVFLDLKLHDIPNTVRKAAQSIAALGVDMFNVHAAGGKQMMLAALEGAERGSGTTGKPLIVAVTQLTSTDQKVLNEEIGIPGTVEDAVLRYARLAQEAGMDGVVASPLEVLSIKKTCGSRFLTVTPGIRPAGTDAHDQSRIMTPESAFAQGTDFIVMGRPITQAPDPRLALEQVIEKCLVLPEKQE